jgi:hypothetical protein
MAGQQENECLIAGKKREQSVIFLFSLMGSAFKVKDGLTTAWRPTGGRFRPPKGILAPKMVASPGFGSG